MDALSQYREIVEGCLREFAAVKYAIQDLSNEAVFDRQQDRYVVMSMGWDNRKRVHGALIHIDIIDGKVWVQRDGTEEGIACKLVEAGIRREDIVLGFRPAELRTVINWGQAG